MSMEEVTLALLNRAMEDGANIVPSHDLPDDTYYFTHNSVYAFELNEMKCGDRSLPGARVCVTFEFRVEHRGFTWHYNFIDRGVSAQYQDTYMGHRLQAIVTQIVTDDGEVQTGLTATFARDDP